MKLIEFFQEYWYNKALARAKITSRNSLSTSNESSIDPDSFAGQMANFYYFNISDITGGHYSERFRASVRFPGYDNYTYSFPFALKKHLFGTIDAQPRINSQGAYYGMFDSTKNPLYDRSLYTIPHHSEFDLLFAHYLDNSDSLKNWGHDWTSFPRQVLTLNPTPPFSYTRACFKALKNNLHNMVEDVALRTFRNAIKLDTLDKKESKQDYQIDFLDDSLYIPLLNLDCDSWFGHIISYPDYFSRWFCDDSRPCVLTETILPSIYDVFSFWGKTYFLLFLIIVFYRLHTLVYIFFSSLKEEDFMTLRTYGGFKIESITRHIAILPKSQYLLFLICVFFIIAYLLNYSWWIPPILAFKSSRKPPTLKPESVYDLPHTHGGAQSYVERELWAIYWDYDLSYNDEEQKYWYSVRKRNKKVVDYRRNVRQTSSYAKGKPFRRRLHYKIPHWNYHTRYVHSIYQIIPRARDEIIKIPRYRRYISKKGYLTYTAGVIQSSVDHIDTKHFWFQNYLFKRLRFSRHNSLIFSSWNYVQYFDPKYMRLRPTFSPNTQLRASQFNNHLYTQYIQLWYNFKYDRDPNLKTRLTFRIGQLEFVFNRYFVTPFNIFFNYIKFSVLSFWNKIKQYFKKAPFKPTSEIILYDKNYDLIQQLLRDYNYTGHPLNNSTYFSRILFRKKDKSHGQLHGFYHNNIYAAGTFTHPLTALPQTDFIKYPFRYPVGSLSWFNFVPTWAFLLNRFKDGDIYRDVQKWDFTILPWERYYMVRNARFFDGKSRFYRHRLIRRLALRKYDLKKAAPFRKNSTIYRVYDLSFHQDRRPKLHATQLRIVYPPFYSFAFDSYFKLLDNHKGGPMRFLGQVTPTDSDPWTPGGHDFFYHKNIYIPTRFLRPFYVLGSREFIPLNFSFEYSPSINSPREFRLPKGVNTFFKFGEDKAHTLKAIKVLKHGYNPFFLTDYITTLRHFGIPYQPSITPYTHPSHNKYHHLIYKTLQFIENVIGKLFNDHYRDILVIFSVALFVALYSPRNPLSLHETQNFEVQKIIFFRNRWASIHAPKLKKPPTFPKTDRKDYIYNYLPEDDEDENLSHPEVTQSIIFRLQKFFWIVQPMNSTIIKQYKLFNKLIWNPYIVPLYTKFNKFKKKNKKHVIKLQILIKTPYLNYFHPYIKPIFIKSRSAFAYVLSFTLDYILVLCEFICYGFVAIMGIIIFCGVGLLIGLLTSPILIFLGIMAYLQETLPILIEMIKDLFFGFFRLLRWIFFTMGSWEERWILYRDTMTSKSKKMTYFQIFKEIFKYLYIFLKRFLAVSKTFIRHVKIFFEKYGLIIVLAFGALFFGAVYLFFDWLFNSPTRNYEKKKRLEEQNKTKKK